METFISPSVRTSTSSTFFPAAEPRGFCRDTARRRAPGTGKRWLCSSMYRRIMQNAPWTFARITAHELFFRASLTLGTFPDMSYEGPEWNALREGALGSRSRQGEYRRKYRSNMRSSRGKPPQKEQERRRPPLSLFLSCRLSSRNAFDGYIIWRVL